MKFYPSKRWLVILTMGSIVIFGYYLILPSPLFSDPYSTVLEDRNEILLGASIAGDGQWRFPIQQQVPEKFKHALLLFEDKRFETHIGVDVLALSRAIRQNLLAKRIVSGGSTISMQVIRLMRKNKDRTFVEKIIEIVLATRLELSYSKNEILALYVAHAPFGGNVVGLEAACWRYFHRPASTLSWSEASLLAVLPNNPSLIHPGKNRSQLMIKRNRLLDRLHQSGYFDAVTLELARAEPLSEKPLSLPRFAPHLLERLILDGQAQQRIRSTVDQGLQKDVTEIIQHHQKKFSGNGINNSAAIIAEVTTGNVLAYVGNSTTEKEHANQVDIIMSERSTGSILKPFLFAAMLDEGMMLQNTLVPDIPTTINGFSPKNFSKGYDGAVPADQALIRSLNIPAIHELQEFRYEKFYEILQRMGMQTLHNPPDHYGLSLILGGAEGTLWDVTGMYASMARTLNNYFERPGVNRYDKSDFHSLKVIPDNAPKQPVLEQGTWLSAPAIWLTFEALLELYRPGEETGWKNFSSSRKVAWKTGTSFGFRDGWAIGVDADHVVGVWVGNADGEGRPGLTGTETAAPVLFDILSRLNSSGWFSQPIGEMVEVEVCSQSGQRISEYCNIKRKSWITRTGLQSDVCSFHRRIHLSKDGLYRVNNSCASLTEMEPVNWFVLPAVQEYYFKSRNISYKSMPPLQALCDDPSSVSSMDLIYPKLNSSIFVPRELDGSESQTVFQVAHRIPSSVVYWHLDGVYVGSTRSVHKLSLTPKAGEHHLVLVDNQGETLERTFSIKSISSGF
ncbi:MAG: penicillin-binding protein 1C [Flammeovirgaceae bacterium]|nr:penicillin-binding protein 1C [Flammeovirgaceae bacterium]